MSAKNPNTVYFHIGTIKTGTTSLQHFFHHNRGSLLDYYNIYFPKSPGPRNHTKLPLYAYDENVAELRIRHNLHSAKALEQFRNGFRAKLIEEIDPHLSKGKDLLFSSEHLSSRAISAEEIKQLISLFSDYKLNFKAIVYLRRQDKMMLSTYSTWVKSGGRWNLNPNAYKNRRYNHLQMIELWASVLGEENIIVKVFEKSRMLNGDLFHDFCSTLGIDSLDKLIIPKNEKLNTSLDQEQIQFLKLFNKFVPSIEAGTSNPERGKLVSFLEAFSKENKLDVPFEQKQKIYEYFEEDNNKIAKHYIKDGLPLFDPLKKSTEVVRPIRLTPEKAVEIAAYLWVQQQREINKKTRWYDEIKKSLKKLFRL